MPAPSDSRELPGAYRELAFRLGAVPPQGASVTTTLINPRMVPWNARASPILMARMDPAWGCSSGIEPEL